MKMKEMQNEIAFWGIYGVSVTFCRRIAEVLGASGTFLQVYLKLYAIPGEIASGESA